MTLSAPSSSFTSLMRDTHSMLQEQDRRLQVVEESTTTASHEEQLCVLRREQPIIDCMLNNQIDALKEHAKKATPAQCIEEGKLLRAVCKPFVQQAPFVRRTNQKPRGYQGDSEMMRMIYANDWQGPTLLGKLMHKYFISVPAAEAVRNRRALIAEDMRASAERSPTKPIEVLSVACGPAQEVADIFRTHDDFSSFKVTLLDQDPEALSEAEQNIQRAESRSRGKANVQYEKQSIGALLRPGATRERLGTFDFIYSMGLYDYLDEATATKLTSALFDMLKPGGTLLLGNYSSRCSDAVMMEYWLDWPLVYRNEEEFARLLSPSRSQDVTVGFESAGVQMFLRARKPAELKARL